MLINVLCPLNISRDIMVCHYKCKNDVPPVDSTSMAECFWKIDKEGVSMQQAARDWYSVCNNSATLASPTAGNPSNSTWKNVFYPSWC